MKTNRSDCVPIKLYKNRQWIRFGPWSGWLTCDLDNSHTIASKNAAGLTVGVPASVWTRVRDSLEGGLLCYRKCTFCIWLWIANWFPKIGTGGVHTYEVQAVCVLPTLLLSDIFISLHPMDIKWCPIMIWICIALLFGRRAHFLIHWPFGFPRCKRPVQSLESFLFRVLFYSIT